VKITVIYKLKYLYLYTKVENKSAVDKIIADFVFSLSLLKTNSINTASKYYLPFS